MHREGHVGAALLAYAPVGFVLAVAGFRFLSLIGGVAAVGLAMLPDYDQRVPVVDHRGPTHTVWFAVAVGVVGAVVGGAVGWSTGVVASIGLAVFGFVVEAVSIGSHIAADALTPMGVTPFAPVRTRYYTYDVTKAANPIANYALLAIGAVAALVGVGVGVRVASLVG
jgi:inner membrane protein